MRRPLLGRTGGLAAVAVLMLTACQSARATPTAPVKEPARASSAQATSAAHATQHATHAAPRRATTDVEYFTFHERAGQEFTFELTDPQKIGEARSALFGGHCCVESHVTGLVVRGRADYNPGWSYHLDPDSVDLFVDGDDASPSPGPCDANMQDVEDRLAEVGGSFLPDGRWCPQDSQLMREGIG